MPLMAGRQAFLEILRAAGVEYIIGNPGTTELPLMDVLPDHPDFKYILTLQEGVAMAMADGYALASGKLGVLNVHVAPGLGNAMACCTMPRKRRPLSWSPLDNRTDASPSRSLCCGGTWCAWWSP